MVITTPFSGLGLDIDKLFNTTNNTPAYPPYNIIKFTDDEYTLQFAVAGFKKEDISITTEKSILKITGSMAEAQLEDSAQYIHKGIAGRKFSRAFTLPEYFEVDWAGMEDGILSISLIRNVPEEKKPKTITIE
jgi:molecular chaperone IbpA